MAFPAGEITDRRLRSVFPLQPVIGWRIDDRKVTLWSHSPGHAWGKSHAYRSSPGLLLRCAIIPIAISKMAINLWEIKNHYMKYIGRIHGFKLALFRS